MSRLLLRLIAPITIWVCCLTESRPMSNSMFDSEMIRYLKKYGYLTHSESSMNMVSGEQVRDAVRNLQFFANLQDANGQVDEHTRDLIGKPRCGMPDVVVQHFRNKREENNEEQDGHDRLRRYAVQGERWPRLHLSWRLKQPPSHSDSDSDSIRAELWQALWLWSSSTPLVFTEVSKAEKADLEVSFVSKYHGDGHPFDGPGQVLAHAFFPGAGRGGDVHLDDDETWSVQSDITDSHRTSVFVVAAHEFGHALGLAHSNQPQSIMFPWYLVNPHRLTLPKDDANAIALLYGQREEESTDNYQQETSSTSSPPTSTESASAPGSASTAASGSTTWRPPRACSVRFDAVATIRGEMWAFSSNYFWRIDANRAAEPVSLSSFWYGLPPNLTELDAVYERRDNKIVFFVGRHFYVLNGNARLLSGPEPLTHLGLPNWLEKLDGAMRWGWNSKVYFFAQKFYWRFDEVLQQVELDYPRTMDVWKGVPQNIDAVFQHTDGRTYFFKDEFVYTFDDVRMSVVNPPQLISQRFMQCQSQPIKDAFLIQTSDTPSDQPQHELLLLLLLLLHALACPQSCRLSQSLH